MQKKGQMPASSKTFNDQRKWTESKWPGELDDSDYMDNPDDFGQFVDDSSNAEELMRHIHSMMATNLGPYEQKRGQQLRFAKIRWQACGQKMMFLGTSRFSPYTLRSKPDDRDASSREVGQVIFRMDNNGLKNKAYAAVYLREKDTDIDEIGNVLRAHPFIMRSAGDNKPAVFWTFL